MNKIEIKEEIESLVKTTEKTREVLKNSWKKVEDLDAAIQSAKSDQQQRKEDRKSNSDTSSPPDAYTKQQA